MSAYEKVERTLPMILQWDENFDIGSDTLTGVNYDDYQPPFPLMAKLDKLTIKVVQLSPRVPESHPPKTGGGVRWDPTKHGFWSMWRARARDSGTSRACVRKSEERFAKVSVIQHIHRALPPGIDRASIHSPSRGAAPSRLRGGSTQRP